MAWRRSPGQDPDPIGRGARWITSGISVAVAIFVMSVTESLLWGLVAFVVLGIMLNLAILVRQGGRF